MKTVADGIQIEARGDLLIVTQSQVHFIAIYARAGSRTELVLMRRTPTADKVLLAQAWQAATTRLVSLAGLPSRGGAG